MSIYKRFVRGIRDSSKKLVNLLNPNSLVIDDFAAFGIIGLVISVIGFFWVDDIYVFFVGIVSGTAIVLLFLIVSAGVGWLSSSFFDSEKDIFKPLLRFLLGFQYYGAIIMSCIGYSGYSTAFLGVLFVLSCAMLTLSRR